MFLNPASAQNMNLSTLPQHFPFHPHLRPAKAQLAPPETSLESSESCIHLGGLASGTTKVPRSPEPVYSFPLREAFGRALKGKDEEAEPHGFAKQGLYGFGSSSSLSSLSSLGMYGVGNQIDQYGSRDAVFRSNSRTGTKFKPQKAGRGTTSWQLRQFAEATLGSGSLRKAVRLPEGEDINEWLAVSVVDFYNQINLLYGSITEFCSPQTCPEMKATDEFEYLWQDSERYKKPTKMPAPEYIEHLMAWVQSNVDNEQMFPSKIGVPFPKAFPSLVRQMFKRLYRVYAHIYCHHYAVIMHLGLEPHLNTSFKHYVLFIDEHGLASGKDYWGPMGDLVESMLRSD